MQPDILSFAKGVTSGYLPLGGITASKAIKDAMDSVKPEDRWMHAYTYSAHPTCCAVGLKNIEIIERERLCENAAKMGECLHAGLPASFSRHPNAGDIRGGKGLLAAVEFVDSHWRVIKASAVALPSKGIEVGDWSRQARVLVRRSPWPPSMRAMLFEICLEIEQLVFQICRGPE